MKRFIYGIPLILATVWLVYSEWYIPAALLAGFLIGFITAVDMMYKRVTGHRMDNDGLTEVMEKLLP